jgi:hypothetical protein
VALTKPLNFNQKNSDNFINRDIGDGLGPQTTKLFHIRRRKN